MHGYPAASDCLRGSSVAALSWKNGTAAALLIPAMALPIDSSCTIKLITNFIFKHLTLKTTHAKCPIQSYLT